MNQSITQLNNLQSNDVNPNDLLLIVDVEGYSSPNGETKNIRVSDLGEFYNINISSVSEQVTQSNHGFLVGNVLRINSTSSLYVTSSANTITGEEAEVIGIVSSIIDQNTFNFVYDGIVNFQSGSYPVWAPTGMTVGTTYFLYDNGILINQDPTDVLQISWVSKPLFIAITPSKGVLNKQRGFYRAEYQETAISKLYVTQSNAFFVGDVVRKTKETETSSLGLWTLASSDTYDSAQVIGVVSDRSANYFGITLSGNINGLSNLQEGETYYLLPSSSFNSGSYYLNQRNVTSTFPVSPPTSSIIAPIYIATSNTSAVINKSSITLNNYLYYNNKPVTYGPFPYISQVQPDTGSVVTLIENILPNARLNESAEVYWMFNNLGRTNNAPVQSSNWILTMTTNGWEILG